MARINEYIIKSVIIGHAIGDALGVPVEFESREKLMKNPVTGMGGHGTYPVPAGSWSDDTSMTLCALESLSKGEFDANDIMENFGKWYYNNEFTPTGITFDMGNTCSAAIENYFKYGKDIKNCGLTDEYSNGNGSLMRIAPAVLFSVAKYGTKKFGRLWENVEALGSLTHNHSRSRLACGIYATILNCLIQCPDKMSIAKGIYQYKRWYNNFDEMKHYDNLCFSRLMNIDESQIKSTGYVVDTLEAALWCLINSDSYKECVLKAVNLGDDTDTIAAIAGSLAGALYGYDSIPEEWLNKLQRREYIEALCKTAAENWIAP